MNPKLYNPDSAESRESLAILTGVHPNILAKWNGSDSPGVKAFMDDGEDGDNQRAFSPLTKSKAGKNFLDISGPIVTDDIAGILRGWLGMACVTGQEIRMALDKMDGSELTVRINSPGGVVTEASVIYESIVRLGKSGVDTKTNILGLAASSATLVMLATEIIEMSPLGFMFIHSAHSLVHGNQYMMRAEADKLDKYDISMAKMYAERIGEDVTAAKKIMSAITDSPEGRGTWFTAEEAKEHKFITSVLSKDEEIEDPEVNPAEGSLDDIFSGDLARFKAMSFVFNTVRI